MKKISIFVCLLIGLSISTLAQRSEVGLFAGGSYYLGDLNPSKQFGNTSPAFGFIYRYNFNLRWTLKMNAYYGTIKGDDASSAGFDPQRNLNFTSRLLEFGGQMELNFFPYYTGSEKFNFTPYIFLGLSIFNFNPRTQLNGDWYDLQQLGTEGQGTTEYPGRKPYALTQVGVPFGVGMKISLTKLLCLGIEWGMRKTFTDYLDDVSTTYPDPFKLAQSNGVVAAMLSNRSLPEPGLPPVEPGMQRGNSKTMDWYSFAGITFTIKIMGAKDKGCRDYQERHKYKEFLYD